MGQVFGSTDGLGPQGNKLGKNASANDLGISGGQLFARKALAGGLYGLGQGMNTPNMAKQSISPPINVPQAPQVDPSMFGMGRPKNPFYGG